jgi:hypothetical protein
MDRVLSDIQVRDNTLALQGEKELKKQIKEERNTIGQSAVMGPPGDLSPCR